MTSAGTLHPYMREKIEQTFTCKVYNRYGSQRSRRYCLRTSWEKWPVGGAMVVIFIEIVDDQYNRVQDGMKVEILVTSLTNYAMPFIRYKIERSWDPFTSK